MAHKINSLNDDFGVMIDGVCRKDLLSSEFRQKTINFKLKMVASLVCVEPILFN